MRTRTKSSVFEVLHDRLQPVVAGEASSDLHPHAAHRQIELVVHDDDPPRILDAVTADELRDGLSGEVHVGLRERERDVLLAPLHLGDERLLLRSLQRGAGALCEQRDDFSAEVVAAASILLARIPQSHDEEVGRSTAPFRTAAAEQGGSAFVAAVKAIDAGPSHGSIKLP